MEFPIRHGFLVDRLLATGPKGTVAKENDMDASFWARTVEAGLSGCFV